MKTIIAIIFILLFTGCTRQNNLKYAPPVQKTHYFPQNYIGPNVVCGKDGMCLQNDF